MTISNEVNIKEILKEYNIPLSKEINDKIKDSLFQYGFISIVKLLKNQNNLNRAYIQKLFDSSCSYDELEIAFDDLKVNGALSSSHIDIVFNNLNHTYVLSKAILFLHNEKVDSTPYLTKLTADTIDFAPQYVTFLLVLDKSGIADKVKEEYEDSFLKSAIKNDQNISDILMMLAEANIFQENFYTIIRSPHLDTCKIINSLMSYHKKGLLNQKTFNKVFSADDKSINSDIAQIDSCFLIRILDDAQYESIKNNPVKVKIVSELLEDLEKNSALTKKNFNHIYNNILHKISDIDVVDLEDSDYDYTTVDKIFEYLHVIGLATQTNQELILQHYPMRIDQLKDFSQVLSQLDRNKPGVIIGNESGRNILKLQKQFYDLYSVVFGKMGSEEWQQKLIFDPRFAKSEEHPELKIRTLSIKDGGRSLSDGPIILKRILREQSLLISQDTATFNQDNIPESKDSVEVQLVKEDLATYVKHLEFQSILGRTLLFKDQDTSHIVAIKVRKKAEDINELRKEYTTASELRKHKYSLGLKSEIPEPKAIMQLNHVRDYLIANNAVDPDLLTVFENLVGEFENEENLEAYVYEASDDYFTYLYRDISYKTYFHANEIIVRDLCVLLKNGLVYDRLADIFHNRQNNHFREDGGRYQILVDLLSPTFSFGGDGMISAWQKAVEYPNVRKSGLADLGDWRLLDTVLDSNSDFVKGFCPNLFSATNTHIEAQNSIIAHFLAEYMLVLQLIAGMRALEVTKGLDSDSEDTQHVWLMMAKQMILNCAIAMGVMADIPEDIAMRYLERRIDVVRYAEQMMFWMTNKHIYWVKEKRLPPGLYAPELEINFGDMRHDTWNDRMGNSFDGINPDLGHFNGQNPLKEGTNLFYSMLIGTFIGKEVSDSFSEQQAYKNLTMFAQANADKVSKTVTQPNKSNEVVARLQRTYRENKHSKMKSDMMDEKVNNLYPTSVHFFSSRQSAGEEKTVVDNVKTSSTKIDRN